MTISELKAKIADLPDDMQVMAYDDGNVTRQGDWHFAEVYTGFAIATTYGGFHSHLDDKNVKTEFTQGDPFKALFISY